MNGKKTYLAAAGAILGAVGGVLTGTMDYGTAATIVVQAILAATVRHGVAKAQGGAQ